MATIKRSIFIEAATEAVTAVTEDANRLPEWFTGAERVEIMGDYPAVGSVVYLDMQAPGMAFKLTFTVLEHVSNQKLVVKMAGLTNGTNTWLYRAIDEGTVVEYTLDYTLSDGAEGQTMGQMISARANEISIGHSLSKLKALIEDT